MTRRLAARTLPGHPKPCGNFRSDRRLDVLVPDSGDEYWPGIRVVREEGPLARAAQEAQVPAVPVVPGRRDVTTPSSRRN